MTEAAYTNMLDFAGWECSQGTTAAGWRGRPAAEVLRPLYSILQATPQHLGMGLDTKGVCALN